jgi:hypothetical protein
MTDYNRRAFIAMSVGGAAALSLPPSLAAAAQCVSGALPAFLPNSLTVDCASKRNFRTFRQYADYVGLAGVVSMSFVRGSNGSFPAGNLFLFPWIKANGQGRTFAAAVPTNATSYINSSAIPDATLPLDEYFCRYKLQAPWTAFIGFQLDTPFGFADSQRDWFSNVDKLADGSGVGIDWTSSNLNTAWFGGSNWIPKTNDCSGSAWRQLIISGLNQASVGAC